MKKVRHRSVLATCVACLGFALAGCSGEGDGTPSGSQSSAAGFGQTLDPLLAGATGAQAASCVKCIEGSCSTELTALETELKTLRSATRAAFACVESAGCLSHFWSDVHDAGSAAAKEAVLQCIAACDADAGLPGQDAAESAIMTLAEALETCVDTSCSASCVGAERDAGADHDAGAVLTSDGGHDAGVEHDAGMEHDAGEAHDAGTGHHW